MIALVRQGMSIDEAIATADEEAQERQAATPEAGGMGQPPGPAAMPGLANPGEGAEMGGGIPMQGPSDNLTKMRELVNALQATGGNQ
jgi:hypothetical protein